MAITLQEYCDHRPHTGYGSQLMYKLDSESKYHLLTPLEGVPTVTGSVETYEFDILTCPSRGQLQGKESLENAETNFMWHRDNILRLKSLRGVVLNLLKVHPDFTAEAFVGTVDFRSDDISDDVDRGVLTITPTSIDKDYLLNCRDIIMPTAWFASVVPDTLNIGSTATTLNLTIRPSAATVSIARLNEYGSVDTSAHTDFSIPGSATVSGTSATVTFSRGTTSGQSNAIVALTISATGYAPWTTTIALERDA